MLHGHCDIIYFDTHVVCSELQQCHGFIVITVGVSVAVLVVFVFSMGGFILGMIAGTYRTKSRQATPTQSPPVPTSHSQDRTSPEGVPVYEEIVLDEIKDIPLTGNAAYGYTH